MSAPFVHIHTHSEYSLLDGAARVHQLVEQARKFEQPALALTDHGYMHGIVDFYQKATKAGVKPVLGCEVYFTPDNTLSREKKPELYHMVLLAKNNEGYQNLMNIVSQASVKGFYYKPRVTMDMLRENSAGIIGTSACMSGIIPRLIERGDMEGATKWAKDYASLFAPGDFYLEIQEQNITTDNGFTQAQLNKGIADIGKELGLGLVGTNDIHYLGREDAKTQDLLLCIGTGSNVDDPNRMKFSCDEFYMKTHDEMAAALKGYPEAITNTLEIAEKCNVNIRFDEIILPKFPVPEMHDEASFLREECIKGLKERYGDPIPDNVMERFEHEFKIVNDKGFPAYFLIVAEFTKWAKENGIGVGPGRGSAAGSIISYAMGITMLDPLEQDLLFERFLNPERTEMPDIDMDFDDERRGEVIEYVRDLYGSDRVAQVITFGTLKARMAIRDAGRVLGYPYGIPDKIAKQISSDLNTTIDASLAESKEFMEEYRSNPDTKRVVDAARSLEGIVRGEGVHAAAVVICRDPLYKYVPVKYDTKGGAVITQYDGKKVADLGLLKMDFLGLRNLTVIASAIKNIEKRHGIKLNVDEIDRDDPKIYELLRRADTAGVFQVESQGMRQLLKNLQPTKFADIVAVLALYRPGPLNSGMVQDFVDRKHGKREITYYDERLKPILEDTYGAIVYQEQVMRISMEMSGFSAAKADKLRKAMGKKKLDELAPLEKDWVEGAKENGYDPKLAESLWQDILPFAEYAFNKSHSAAYGLITAQTAYLKSYYPTEYMAAVLTSYMGKIKEIVRYVAECNRTGMRVLPPDVNSSDKDFTPTDEGIRFGLAGIRGVGAGIVSQIIEERDANGPYKDLYDFIYRVSSRQVNKKMLEALIKSGAFDSTGYTRKQLMMFLDDNEALEAVSARLKDERIGQSSMFDFIEDDESQFNRQAPPPDGIEWPEKIKLGFEKEMLGIYVSAHPLDRISDVLDHAVDYTLDQLDGVADGSTVWVAGILNKITRKATKRGSLMAIAELEDLVGSLPLVLFPQTFEEYRDIAVEDNIVRVKGRLDKSDRGDQLLVDKIELFDGAAFDTPPKTLVLSATKSQLTPETMARLNNIFAAHPGRDVLVLRVEDATNGKITRAKLPVTADSAASGMRAELFEVLGADCFKES